MKTFNPRKLNKLEGKDHYCFNISDRLGALANLYREMDTINAFKTVRGNITISGKVSLGYYELKRHKSLFDKVCLVTGSKLGKADNVNNIRCARFKVFMAVTMKNGIFWDFTPCCSCKNRRVRGT
jgi:hypothetical protein